ncbi:MAG: ABC transporter substrate-binding protein [Bdellovibrionota bacterium]
MQKQRMSSILQRLMLGALIFLNLPSCTRPSKVTAPKEKIFRFGAEAKLVSLDPHVTKDVYSSQAQSLFYETLYHYHYLKRPFEIVPVIAESLPEVSKDRKTYKIRLKKGIHFHDDACFPGGKGREVKADDVVYLFHRMATPNFSSPIYGALEDNIEGIKDFHNGKAPSITGVRAIDPYTVEIRLERILPRFLHILTDMRTAILPKECVEKYGDAFARRAVGTGAFVLQEADLASKIVAVRNPNYRHMTYPAEGSVDDAEKGLLADAGKELPLLDKVVFEVVVEAQPRWLKFMKGEYELIGIPKDNLPHALEGEKLSSELQARGIKLFRSIRSDVTATIFNMDDPVWGKKKELRQAYALTLDVPKIIEVQYGNQAIRAHSMIDPSMYGYDPAFKSKWAVRDVKRARALIAKAGYPDGKGLPPIIYPRDSSTLSRQLEELLKAQLAEAGITLQAVPMTWPEMMRTQQTRNFVAMGIGMVSTVPDVEDMMGIINSKMIFSTQNSAAYRNPRVDKLIDEITMIENGPARLAKIKEMIAILDEDLPYVPLTHRIGNQLVQSWVKNHVYTDNLLLGHFVKYHRIETSGERQ